MPNSKDYEEFLKRRRTLYNNQRTSNGGNVSDIEVDELINRRDSQLERQELMKQNRAYISSKNYAIPSNSSDLSPIQQNTEELSMQPTSEDLNWWEKFGAWWQNARNTAVGTFLKMGPEALVDAGATVGAMVAEWTGNQQAADNIKDFISHDYTSELVTDADWFKKSSYYIWGDYVYGNKAHDYAYNENATADWVKNIASGVGSSLGFAAYNAVPYVGWALAGTAMGGLGAEEAINEGASAGEAFGYGVLSSAIECGTELLVGRFLNWVGGNAANVINKASGGRLNLSGSLANDIIGGIGKSKGSSVIVNLVKNMNEEGMEELVSDALNPIIKQIYKRSSDNFWTNYEANFQEQGGWQGLLESYIYGGLSAGAMQTVGTIGNVGKYRSLNAVRYQNSINEIAEINEEMTEIVKKYGNSQNAKYDAKYEALQARKNRIQNKIAEDFSNWLDKVKQGLTNEASQELVERGEIISSLDPKLMALQGLTGENVQYKDIGADLSVKKNSNTLEIQQNENLTQDENGNWRLPNNQIVNGYKRGNNVYVQTKNNKIISVNENALHESFHVLVSNSNQSIDLINEFVKGIKENSDNNYNEILKNIQSNYSIDEIKNSNTYKEAIKQGLNNKQAIQLFYDEEISAQYMLSMFGSLNAYEKYLKGGKNALIQRMYDLFTGKRRPSNFRTILNMLRSSKKAIDTTKATTKKQETRFSKENENYPDDKGVNIRFGQGAAEKTIANVKNFIQNGGKLLRTETSKGIKWYTLNEMGYAKELTPLVNSTLEEMKSTLNNLGLYTTMERDSTDQPKFQIGGTQYELKQQQEEKVEKVDTSKKETDVKLVSNYLVSQYTRTNGSIASADKELLLMEFSEYPWWTDEYSDLLENAKNAEELNKAFNEIFLKEDSDKFEPLLKNAYKQQDKNHIFYEIPSILEYDAFKEIKRAIISYNENKESDITPEKSLKNLERIVSQSEGQKTNEIQGLYKFIENSEQLLIKSKITYDELYRKILYARRAFNQIISVSNYFKNRIPVDSEYYERSQEILAEIKNAVSKFQALYTRFKATPESEYVNGIKKKAKKETVKKETKPKEQVIEKETATKINKELVKEQPKPVEKVSKIDKNVIKSIRDYASKLSQVATPQFNIENDINKINEEEIDFEAFNKFDVSSLQKTKEGKAYKDVRKLLNKLIYSEVDEEDGLNDYQRYDLSKTSDKDLTDEEIDIISENDYFVTVDDLIASIVDNGSSSLAYKRTKIIADKLDYLFEIGDIVTANAWVRYLKNLDAKLTSNKKYASRSNTLKEILSSHNGVYDETKESEYYRLVEKIEDTIEKYSQNKFNFDNKLDEKSNQKKEDVIKSLIDKNNNFSKYIEHCLEQELYDKDTGLFYSLNNLIKKQDVKPSTINTKYTQVLNLSKKLTQLYNNAIEFTEEYGIDEDNIWILNEGKSLMDQLQNEIKSLHILVENVLKDFNRSVINGRLSTEAINIGKSFYENHEMECESIVSYIKNCNITTLQSYDDFYTSENNEDETKTFGKFIENAIKNGTITKNREKKTLSVNKLKERREIIRNVVFNVEQQINNLLEEETDPDRKEIIREYLITKSKINLQRYINYLDELNTVLANKGISPIKSGSIEKSKNLTKEQKQVTDDIEKSIIRFEKGVQKASYPEAPGVTALAMLKRNQYSYSLKNAEDLVDEIINNMVSLDDYKNKITFSFTDGKELAIAEVHLMLNKYNNTQWQKNIAKQRNYDFKDTLLTSFNIAKLIAHGAYFYDSDTNTKVNIAEEQEQGNIIAQKIVSTMNDEILNILENHKMDNKAFGKKSPLTTLAEKNKALNKQLNDLMKEYDESEIKKRINAEVKEQLSLEKQLQKEKNKEKIDKLKAKIDELKESIKSLKEKAKEEWKINDANLKKYIAINREVNRENAKLQKANEKLRLDSLQKLINSKENRFDIKEFERLVEIKLSKATEERIVSLIASGSIKEAANILVNDVYSDDFLNEVSTMYENEYDPEEDLNIPFLSYYNEKTEDELIKSFEILLDKRSTRTELGRAKDRIIHIQARFNAMEEKLRERLDKKTKRFNNYKQATTTLNKMKKLAKKISKNLTGSTTNQKRFGGVNPQAVELIKNLGATLSSVKLDQLLIKDRKVPVDMTWVKELHNFYKGMQAIKELNVDWFVSETENGVETNEIINYIEALNSIDDFALTDVDYLTLIDDVMGYIQTTMEDEIGEREITINNKTYKLSEFALQGLEENKALITNGKERYSVMNGIVAPVAVFERMSGYNDDAVLMKLYKALMEGEYRRIQAYRIFNAQFQTFRKEKGSSKFLKNITKNKLTVEINGENVEMTEAQALSFVESYQRAHALKHMINEFGGIEVDGKIYKFFTEDEKKSFASKQKELKDLKEKLRTDKSKAKNDTDRIDLLNEKFDEDSKKINDDMQSIIDAVSEKARKVYDSISNKLNIKRENGKFIESNLYTKFLTASEKFFALAGQFKEQTDLVDMGYTNIIKDFYFPIRNADGDKQLNVNDSGYFTSNMITSRNYGFNKNTTGIRGAIKLVDINDIITRELKQRSNDFGYRIVANNFKKVLNYKFTNGVTMASAIEARFTASDKHKFIDYIANLLMDAQNMGAFTSSATDNLFKKVITGLRGHVATVSLGLNPKVMLSQTASIFAARRYIKYRYLLGALKSGFGPSIQSVKYNAETNEFEIADLSKKYPPKPEALIYRAENHDITSAETQGAIDSTNNLLSSGINAFDTFAINVIWVASLEQTKTNGQYNIEKATELALKTVSETQPNYTAIGRSELLRSKSDLVKLFTMFKSQASQNLTLLYRAINKIVYKKSHNIKLNKDDWDELGSTLVSLLIQGIVYTMMGQIFKHLIDGTIAEEKDWNSELKSFTSSFVNDNVLSLIPILDQIEVDLFNENWQNKISLNYLSAGWIDNYIKLIQDASDGKVSPKEITKWFSYTLGLPLSNAYKYTKTIMQYIPLTKDWAYQVDVIYNGTTVNKATVKNSIKEEPHYTRTYYKMYTSNTLSGLDNSTLSLMYDLYKKGYTDTILLPIPSEYTENGEVKNYDKNQFLKDYGKVVGVLNKISKSSQFGGLNDKVKSDLIVKIIKLYHTIAKKNQNLDTMSLLESIIASNGEVPTHVLINYFMASSIEATLNSTKKELITKYLKSQRLTASEKYFIYNALGYKVDNSKLSQFLNHTGLTPRQIKLLLN